MGRAEKRAKMRAELQSGSAEMLAETTPTTNFPLVREVAVHRHRHRRHRRRRRRHFRRQFRRLCVDGRKTGADAADATVSANCRAEDGRIGRLIYVRNSGRKWVGSLAPALARRSAEKVDERNSIARRFVRPEIVTRPPGRGALI